MLGKTWEDIKFTPQADPQHRDSLQQNKQTNSNKTTKKPANPEEGVESDFQSYHIIRFKCPVFTKKHKIYKETGKYGPFKVK